MRRDWLGEGPVHTGMGQAEIVLHRDAPPLLTQSVGALTRGRAASPHRCAPLAQAPIEPFDQCRLALPAAGRSPRLDCRWRAKHHAVPHRAEAPSAHGLDHLGVQQRRQRPPAGLGRRPSGLAPRRLQPGPAVGPDGGEVRRGPGAQKERSPPGTTSGARCCNPAWARGRSPTWPLRRRLLSASIAVPP
jgi:hypothetical protein